jgi:hypothetical protein
MRMRLRKRSILICGLLVVGITIIALSRRGERKITVRFGGWDASNPSLALIIAHNGTNHPQYIKTVFDETGAGVITPSIIPPGMDYTIHSSASGRAVVFVVPWSPEEENRATMRTRDLPHWLRDRLMSKYQENVEKHFYPVEIPKASSSQ